MSNIEKTYAEVLFIKYEGKIIEILFDSDWGAQKWSDYDINNKPILIGKLISVLSNCIDVEVNISTNSSVYTKIISVNAWSILSVSELNDNISHVYAFTKQVLGKQ